MLTWEVYIFHQENVGLQEQHCMIEAQMSM